MTKYAPQTRAAIRKAFAVAKDYLADGETFNEQRTKFICLALDEAERRDRCSALGARLARNIINNRLGRNMTLDGWLRDEGVRNFSYRRLQAHRHAWLNLLIKEFSK